MSEKSKDSNKNNGLKEIETEDGEIEDFPFVDVVLKEDESEHDNITLNVVEEGLRCPCCEEIFCDPVSLKCQHLIDRSCASNKKVGAMIECPQCHQHTKCDDVDELQTDFDIASRIPPNLRTLISELNDRKSKRRRGLKKRGAMLDDSECIIPNKVRKNSRWNRKEEGSNQSISRALSDIISSNNVPKNITMSQFKKFTEISNKTGIMTLLTNAVIQSTKTDDHPKNSKKVDAYADSEVLEMMPIHELQDIFELEKAQFILLYKDALTKGVIFPPTINDMGKTPLLPTPKPKSTNLVKVKNIISPKKHKKISSESSGSDVSVKSSNETSSSSDKSSVSVHSDIPLKPDNSQAISQSSVTKKVDKTPVKVKEQITPTVPNPVSKVLKLLNESLPEKPMSSDNQTLTGSASYRDGVNKLHLIYSTMYHASLKMKEFQNNLQSPEYHSAYQTYTDNYAQYQTLYSSIQSALNMDSTVMEKNASLSNLGDNLTSDGNTHSNKLTPQINQEQASSTRSPGVYVPDSTDNLLNEKIQPSPQNRQSYCNTSLGVSDLQKYKKQYQLINKKKFGYLWISNLCKDTRVSDLCKLFSTFGHVSKIKLFQYKAHTPVSFFSLIFMSNFTEAESAYRELQNTTFLGRQIHIRMLENDPLADEERSL